MDKQEKLRQLKGRKEVMLKEVELISEDIDKIENQKEIGLSEVKSELYKCLANEKSAFKIVFKKEKYEHILGGDGRSSAWSEYREGSVAYVSCDYYYDDGYRSGCLEFIEKTLKANGVNDIKYV